MHNLIETQTQQNITDLVEEYIQTFPEEFKHFQKGISQKVELNSKWAEVEGSDIIERQLFEIPETLFNMFKLRLNEEDFKYLFPDPDIHLKNTSSNFNKGPRWFAKKFKAFRVTKNV